MGLKIQTSVTPEYPWRCLQRGARNGPRDSTFGDTGVPLEERVTGKFCESLLDNRSEISNGFYRAVVHRLEFWMYIKSTYCGALYEI